MLFARRRSRIQQATVEIDDGSSSFLRFVVMALCGDRRSQRVNHQREPIGRLCSAERRSGTWSAALTVRWPSAEQAFTDVG
jgi:hypothetical protein